MKRAKNKTRKRTNSNLPAKGRLRDIADQLWSIAVRSDWQWKCAVCGKMPCEAHHLIPRQHPAMRHNLRNGIALCSSHHQFCAKVSPHQNAAGWMRWLKEHQELRHDWLVETVENGDHLKFDGTTNAVYYCGIILDLRAHVEPDQFRQIVGVKLSEYLLADKT